MSDNAPTNVLGKGRISAFLQKKYLGIKGLYWAGIVVAVFAFYALRMRSTVDVTESEAATDAAAAPDGDALTAGDSPGATADFAQAYPTMPSGTVVVAPPQTATGDLANSSITTNSEWVTKGVGYLKTKGISGTVAQTALATYVAGGQISTVQRAYVDLVIAEYGVPPYADEIAPVGGARKFQRYVRKAGSTTIYAQYDDGSLWALTYKEWSALPEAQRKFDEVPASDPLWAGETRLASTGAIWKG